MLAAMNRAQRWLANRVHLPIPILNKIANKRRFPTEEQSLRIAVGRVCTDAERVLFDKFDEVDETTGTDNGLLALANYIKKQELSVELVAAEASMGVATLRAMLEGRLKISDEEMVRLFLVVVIRDQERRRAVNEVLEASGDFVLGPVGMRYSFGSG
jgi:hypothetical protein